MGSVDFVGAWLAGMVMVLGTGVASYRVAWALVGPRPAVLRWTAVLVSGSWMATAGFHLLFPLSLFRVPFGAIACFLLGIGSQFVRREIATRRMLAHDLRIAGHVARRTALSAAGALVLFFVPFVVLRLLRTLILPPLGWDSIAYHGVRAAIFVQNAGFTFDEGPGTWDFYRNFFAGGELLTAWAMLPFHSDLLAGLAHGLQWLGVGLAVWALARELGLRGLYAALPAWAALFVPTLQLEIPSGYVEPALNLATLAAAAFAVGFIRRAVPSHALLALAAGGLAAGIKLTGSMPVALFAAAVVGVALLSPKHRTRRMPPVLALGCALAAAPVAPWLWQAYRDTGHPFSPVPLEILGVKLGAASAQMQWFRMRDLSAAYTWDGEIEVLRKIFTHPGDRSEGLGLLSALPLVFVPAGLWLGTRRQRGTLTLLSLAMVSVAAMFYLPLFSALRLHWSANCSRFLLTIVLLALPISLLWCPRFPRAGAAYLGALSCAAGFYAIAFADFGWAPFESSLLIWSAATVAFIATVTVWCARRRPSLLVPSLLVLSIAATWLLNERRIELRYTAVRQSVQLHPVPRYWVHGAMKLDDPSEPRRIAVTAGPNHGPAAWLSYFYLGRSFQNRLVYVPISTDGEIIHFGPNDLRRARGSAEAWIRRLDEERITDVVSLIPTSVEQSWMEAMPRRFAKIAGDERWGVFRVLR